MRAPRLENIFSLSIALIFSFVCVYFVLYLMIMFIEGRGFDFRDTGDVIMYFVSMFGASSVLLCATLMAIYEQKEPPVEIEEPSSEEESE